MNRVCDYLVTDKTAEANLPNLKKKHLHLCPRRQYLLHVYLATKNMTVAAHGLCGLIISFLLHITT